MNIHPHWLTYKCLIDGFKSKYIKLFYMQCVVSVSTTSTVSHTSLTSICPGHGPVASTPVNSVQTLLPYLGACPLLKMGKHHEHAEVVKPDHWIKFRWQINRKIEDIYTYKMQ